MGEAHGKRAGVVVSIPLRWGDMDAYGHVNNVTVASILEEARIAVFGVPAGTGADPGQASWVSLLDGVDAGVQVLIAEHRIRYRRPLEYRRVPAAVRVWVRAVKGASIEIAYEVADGLDGTVCIEAGTTMVFSDPSTGRLVRLNEAQRAVLAKLRA